jgi:molybdopterin synthase catalytic subunit
MTVLAIITDGPVAADAESAATQRVFSGGDSFRSRGLVGAAIRFEGIVRRMEPCVGEDGDRPRVLRALDYQTYDPMAGRELDALAKSVAERHGLTALLALHSRGCVAVNNVSFVLLIWSAHRAAGFAAMTEFIDLLKQDVPIWKRPVWAD